MHNRSAKETCSSAVPRNRSGLRACGLLMLGVLWFASQAMAAPGAKPAAQHDKQQPAASDYVGSEMCATCHEEVAKKFANNPHTKMALMHGSSGVTCENCHGAGKAHVDGGGDITKIFNPAKASAKEVDAKCLACHAGAHPELRALAARQGQCQLHQLPQHSRQQGSEALLKASQPTLCFQCHADQKAAVQHALPSQGE